MLLLYAVLLCYTATVAFEDSLIRYPPSPCPTVFSYERAAAEVDRWYGVILVLTDTPLPGLRLDITLDKPAELVGNWLGPVSSRDNVRYTILKTGEKVMPGPPIPVRIFVKFALERDMPFVKQIKLNGKVICTAMQEEVISQETPSNEDAVQTQPLTITHQTTEVETTTASARPLGSPSGYCGHVRVQPRPLITHGEDTEKGMWPWHAAIYQTKDADVKYTCGGSLISSQHVVTACQCVTSQLTGIPLDPEILVVYLGKYQLYMWTEEGVQVKQVKKIYVHPEYSASKYTANIAVLLLSSPVEFNDLVTPVCLWGSKHSDLHEIEGRDGTVVGWGFDETGQVTNSLMMARMPIVSQEKCVRSKPEFFSRFTNEKTFCAGYKNGTSACNGDSGGGLVLPEAQRDGTTAWFLRGVVSLSVAQRNKTVCDTNHYIVFTDVAKYADWVSQFL